MGTEYGINENKFIIGYRINIFTVTVFATKPTTTNNNKTIPILVFGLL